MESDSIIEKTKHIPSSVGEAEQRMWYRYLRDLPAGSTIVDFGTGWGKSALSLALAAPTARVYTFDIGVTYVHGTLCKDLDEYIQRVREYTKEAQNITFWIGNSLEVTWDALEKPINVLNIDSDHTYETSKKEILRWVPLVKTGGLIFFHDYEHPRCPGIKQAIDELIPGVFDLEFLEKTEIQLTTCGAFRKHADSNYHPNL